jgi:hypothetical protein
VGGVVAYDRRPGSVALAAISPTVKGHTSGGTAGAIAPSINPHDEQVIHREFTLDYLSSLTDVIMEKETGSGGLSYRYVLGLSVEQVVVSGLSNNSGKVRKYEYDDGEFELESESPSFNVAQTGKAKLF